MGGAHVTAQEAGCVGHRGDGWTYHRKSWDAVARAWIKPALGFVEFSDEIHVQLKTVARAGRYLDEAFVRQRRVAHDLV